MRCTAKVNITGVWSVCRIETYSFLVASSETDVLSWRKTTRVFVYFLQLNGTGKRDVVVDWNGCRDWGHDEMRLDGYVNNIRCEAH